MLFVDGPSYGWEKHHVSTGKMVGWFDDTNMLTLHYHQDVNLQQIILQSLENEVVTAKELRF